MCTYFQIRCFNLRCPKNANGSVQYCNYYLYQVEQQRLQQEAEKEVEKKAGKTADKPTTTPKAIKPCYIPAKGATPLDYFRGVGYCANCVAPTYSACCMDLDSINSLHDEPIEESSEDSNYTTDSYSRK